MVKKEPTWVCDCFEMVRKEFLGDAKRIKEIGGEFAMKTALDRLRAVEDVDTSLTYKGCIAITDLDKRRTETGELITKVKSNLKAMKFEVV